MANILDKFFHWLGRTFFNDAVKIYGDIDDQQNKDDADMVSNSDT